MRWVDSYKYNIEWVDSCKWVDSYTMKCGGRPSPGAWYLQIPARGLGRGPGPRPPRAPRFEASVQNLQILGTWPWSGGSGGAQKWSKNAVLRMKFPIVENVRTSSDIVLVTSRGLQLPYRK